MLGLNVFGLCIGGVIHTRFIHTYVYNLAWGALKNGKNGVTPLWVMSRFCLSYFRGIYSEYLSICGTFKLVLRPGRFSHLFHLVLFMVHVRPVLGPCQAGYTILIHNHHTYI